ncbi:MAG TPA: hypothetical protein VKY74_14930 [Chloroflexia bacterium]|nr:hypothetical protein [Chloroflexia bacterium]
MERRFGFRGIRPLDGAGGQERFGLLDLAGGGQAAVLTLQGAAGPPAAPATVRARLDALAAALPETTIQFLLSRRPVDPASLLSRWRAGVEDRCGASTAAGRIWGDLYGIYLPRLEAAGLADLWAGVAVAAPDPEKLAGRVAGLFTALPYQAAPASADELGILVGRLLRPDDPAGAGRAFPVSGDRMLDLPGLAPRSLLLGSDAVALTPGVATSYWQITPPLPRVDGGWVQRLLEFPDLLPYSYDLAIHLRPAVAEQTMRAVLEGRLLHLEGELRRRGGAPAGPPGPGADAEATDTWLLELERREVAERRVSLNTGRERLREAVVLLALHVPADDPDGGLPSRQPRAGAGAAAFARALQAAEISAHPVHGRPALSRAVRALLPLASAAGIRAFPVAAHQAAELALVPAGRSSSRGAPVIGLTPEKTLYTYGGAGSSGHRLLAGGSAAGRRAAARQWALQTYLAGDDLLIWDPAGAWGRWVEALGGRYLRPGGPLPADRLNLLAAPLGMLDQSDFFDAWVREMAGLFSLLLPPITGQDGDAVRSQLGAALLQIGMHSLEQADPAGLTLEALHAELQAGGYQASAYGLEQIATGPAGTLFSPAPPAAAPGLVAIGPPDDALNRGVALLAGRRQAAPGRLAAQIALRRALWPETALLGPARAGGRRAVVLDGIIEALKHAYLAADLLPLAARADGPIALWLLPADEELAPLLAHRAGRALVRPMGCYALFGPAAAMTPDPATLAPTPGLAALIQEARLPNQAAAALPLLSADQALMLVDGAATIVEVITSGLADL